MSDELTKTLVERFLDWPFLAFVLVLVAFFKFNSSFAAWIAKISNLEIGKDGVKIKIGAEKVPLAKVGDAVTARLRDLQEEIETLRKASPEPSIKSQAAAAINPQVIPDGLQDLLVERVYPMLSSKLWLGRFVSTLANASSVSDDAMMQFCKSRPDITLFQDGGRWVAALSDRTKHGMGKNDDVA